MTRKRNQSTFEDLIDIVVLFPWWAGLILAAVFYLWLHHVASTPVVVGQQGQMSAVMTQALYKGLATGGQYVLPLICIIGAGFSALGRRKRKQLLDDVNASPAVSALNEMSWQEFEILVGEVFRQRGCTVTETGGGGADGGFDLVLRKGGEKFLVQCKQWKAYKVGVTTVRELYGVMAAEGATGGFVVTSGVFTQEAKSFAAGKNIGLIDGAELKASIKGMPQQHPATAARPAPQSASAAGANQDCPKCGSAMVKRIARHGANAGNAFWGLRQEQMGELFGRERSVITKHLRNIFAEGELAGKSNVQNLHIAGSDKPVKLYNLDVIISVGYRVKSIGGTRFRQWATQRLREYLVQGYTLNQQRLEAQQEKLDELRQAIAKNA